MIIEIKHITKEQWIAVFNEFRIVQRIDGDIVDGITKPNQIYIYPLKHEPRKHS